MVFLEVKMQGSILIPPDQLVWAVILRLMADFAIRKLDLPLSKLAKGGSETLLVTSAFLKWIISGKRLQASSQSWSPRISDHQLLPKVDHLGKWPPTSSRNEHQISQYVSPAYNRSFNLKLKGHAFILLCQDKRIGIPVYCNTNGKWLSTKKKGEDAQSKFCSKGEASPDPALLCPEDKLQISRG